jgi:hypothetical protein
MEPLDMKTDDLIALLASDPLPPQARPKWQVAGALLIGGLVVITAVMALGIHTDLIHWLTRPTIALKLFWLLVMAIATGVVVRRLSRPGQTAGMALWVWPLAWLVMAALAVLESWGEAQTQGFWLGQTWNVCALNILALSVPLLAALIWTLRDMAPTQPSRTGGVAGLLAGCVAAGLYSLHCTETGLGFFTLWYGGGIALSGLLGAAAGQRFLRW